jgi:hypothetical protein
MFLQDWDNIFIVLHDLIEVFTERLHLVDGIVKSVWFSQGFGLLRVRFRQISLYYICHYV